jgi:signal transduction histidine kinase
MYSREARLRLELHDMAAIIDESLRVYEAACRERSVEIIKSFDGMPPILIDGDQLKVALGNLVSNAIDAMPHGGTLTVSMRREVLEGSPYLAINVLDTGEGIPDEKLKMIFEPFFTTKVLEQGTGLGLSISKKIVEDHGGFIKVESKAGRGSTFSLYFPIRGKAERLMPPGEKVSAAQEGTAESAD